MTNGYWQDFVYESRKEPGSDMPIQEFFSKLGIGEFWPWLRVNIISDTNNFILTLVACFILFCLAYKFDSVLLQIITVVVFIGVLCLKLLII